MFTKPRVRNIILLIISIISIIGLLIYIPFADAEIPDYNCLTQEQNNSELSLNDDYPDILESIHLSFIDYLENDNIEYGVENTTECLQNSNKIVEQNHTPEYPTERGVYLVKEGMPKNTRHLKEGYWIGALPDITNIQPMKDHGIKVVLTVTKTKQSWGQVKQKIRDLGMEHIIIPIGSRFPKDTSFYDILLNYEPNEIFVHCDHGGDRSGTFIAYMLIRRNNWTVQRALLAMVNPSKIDISGLKKVLNLHNYEVSQDDLSYSSIYSGSSNGGFGGLKARNDGYQRLISTMIETL